MFTGVIRAQRWSKLLGVLLALAMVVTVVGFVGASSAYADVLVKYDGGAGVNVTDNTISGLASYGYRTYSSKNCHDAVKFYSTHGATLADILSYAGITSAQLASASTIEFTSTDSTTWEISKSLLLDDTLYYYPNLASDSETGAVAIPTTIALAEKQAKEDYTNLSTSNAPRLFRGQVDLDDQNNDDFRKWVAVINVKP